MCLTLLISFHTQKDVSEIYLQIYKKLFDLSYTTNNLQDHTESSIYPILLSIGNSKTFLD